MKKVFGAVAVGLALLLALAGSAKAQEGNLEMSGKSVACEGVSVWNESNYRITGRCQGLVYPFATQLEHYVLWAQLANGNIVRVDDIDRGYFEGSVNGEFAKVFVTAEGTSNPRRPSDKTVATGNVAKFEFDTAKVVEVVQATPAPATTTEDGTMTVQTTTDSTASSGVSGVIGSILKSLLVIVAVIIAITVVASLVFRRRGSVSA